MEWIADDILLSNRPASFSIIAQTKCILLRVNKYDYNNIFPID